MTWIAVLVSGAWWMAGYYFLDPLLMEVATSESVDVGGHPANGIDIVTPREQTVEEGFISDRRSSDNQCNSNIHDQAVMTPSQHQQTVVATYRDVLFGPEAAPPAAITNINVAILRTLK